MLVLRVLRFCTRPATFRVAKFSLMTNFGLRKYLMVHGLFTCNFSALFCGLFIFRPHQKTFNYLIPLLIYCKDRCFQMAKRTLKKPLKGTFKLKHGFAQMLKGGVIMDVVNFKQAKIAEKAGACAVMALERVPSDIRAAGGVARMADPTKIREIMAAVSIPVMAKCRIGHFAEAQILQELGVDFIDESEVLTPADAQHHINKSKFEVPFVCGCRDLGEALRRIHEGAAMIRTKGEAGTGNVIEAVRHARTVSEEIRRLEYTSSAKLESKASEMKVPLDLLKKTIQLKRLPVVNFAAGGIATPADAALMMQLGVDGVFVGSGIFKSSNPAKYARAIVEATTNFNDPKLLAKVSSGLGEAMKGLEISMLGTRMQERGL